MEDRRMIERLNNCYDSINGNDIRIMEVCGTHTRVISESGIRHILPKEIKLISGPGCPVCVTPESCIDIAIELINNEGVNIIAFGDMMKVKGSHLSLLDVHSLKTRVVYSPEEALNIACQNRDKLFVFLAVGFETTAPLIAMTVKLAKERMITNLYFLTALKLMEPIIRFILQDKRNNINAMICPGHVASIKGADHFKFITEEYSIPAVICGFEGQDIVAGICMLLEQTTCKRSKEFINMYRGCVSDTGNRIAQNIMSDVFDVADGDWRGIGTIRNSALVFNNKYASLDAVKRFSIKVNTYVTTKCLCSEILIGLKTPPQCSLFGSVCTPEHPIGACMVSQEGSCGIYFKYERSEKRG